MKKIKLCLITLGAITSFNASAQLLSQGTVLIDSYYGAPNLGGTFFKAAANNSEYLNFDAGGLGPLGIRGEYMVTDEIGVGLDIGYSSYFISYDDMVFTGYDSDGNSVYATYTYNFLSSKIGFMPTFNFHFVNSDKVALGVVVGAGYKQRIYTVSSNEPGYVGDSENLTLIPMAARVALQGHFFFTPFLGANFGLGIGQGSIVNAGVSFKIGM